MISSTNFPENMKTPWFDLLFLVFFSLIILSKLGEMVDVDEGASSSASYIIKRFENITKGSKDRRSYRGLELNNGLQVLLISRPTLGKASVAMSIAVGTLNDPDELPGMAHLVGDMLNQSGIMAYPETEFADVVESHISVNVQPNDEFPTTKDDKQLFSFKIDADYLSPALDIFAQFFREPFMSTSNSRPLLDASIRRLDWFSLFPESIDRDGVWRFRQMEKSISAEDHPFSRSPYGNLDTFTKYLVEEGTSSQSEHLTNGELESHKTILHDKLRMFYSTWYSSNVMCLVVFGRETLDELESVVVPLFKDVDNKHVEKLNFPYDHHPWGQNQLGFKIYAKPNPLLVSSGDVIRLVFRVPDIRDQYKTAPELYVSRFLSRGGRGSLLSVLRERNLCSQLNVHYEIVAGIGFFAIECMTFNASEIQEDQVIELVFQNIRLLKADGIHEWIFEEDMKINKLSFSSFQFNDSVESLASAMHDYPMDNLLSRKYLQKEWKPSLIEDFLTYLIPCNMNVFIFSKQFQNFTPEQDKWHKIPHRVAIIPHHLIEKWSTVNISSEIQIPTPNEFIVENTNIYPLSEDEPETPYVFHKSGRSRIWLLQFNQFSKINIKFNLFNPRAHLNAFDSTLLCIFPHMLNHLMSNHRYAASIVGYEWDIKFHDSLIKIELDGHADKIHLVLEKIMSKITANNLVQSDLQKIFETAKLKCTNKDEYFYHHLFLTNRLKQVLSETSRTWSHEESNTATKSLQFKDWEKFVPKMLSHVFIQGMISGNCSKQKAMDIVRILESTFKSATELIPQEMLGFLPRVLEIEGGRHFVDILFSDKVEEVHFQYTYYQLGAGTNENSIISSILLRMIVEKCTTSRVNGVMMHHTIYKLYGVIGLLLWSSPNKHPFDLTDSQCDNCLNNVYVMLGEMTDVEFEEYVKLLIEMESVIPLAQSLDSILRGFYDPSERVESAKPLTKSDVIAFFKDTLLLHSPNRRKYTILLLPEKSEWTATSFVSKAIEIEDLIAFKSSSKLWPLPPPFMRLNFDGRRE